jgi:hypothetical protein
VNALRPTIGDTVLEQFTRDWEELALELHQLEMQKRRASAGLKDFVVMRRVESRVQRLSTAFERQRTLFDMFFSSGWDTHPDAARLRKAMMEISVTIGSILRMGHPDRGRGSLAKAISDVEKAQKNVELTLKASIGAKEPVISLPHVPHPTAANPILAVAIVLDILLRFVVPRVKAK